MIGGMIEATTQVELISSVRILNKKLNKNLES